MPRVDSILGQLLEPISRRWFDDLARRHDADRYDKSFGSWAHLVVMIFAQLNAVSSLRALAQHWSLGQSRHYRLGCGPVARSTLADANQRRPVAVFAETFARLSHEADRRLRRDGAQMIRIIDSSPIPLGRLVTFRAYNGRIKGAKLHLVYDPGSTVARLCETTPANVNDIEVARRMKLEKGATYVFDKGYCSYAWWEEIAAAKAFFVTRKKERARFRMVRRRTPKAVRGDGFTVLEDAEVVLKSKGRAKLDIPMRRITIKPDQGRKLVLITNHMRRSAVTIGKLYKARWQIELLFRWLKQNLKLRRFLGRSENAIKVQVLTAMIAYLLISLAHRESRSKLDFIRFVELIGVLVFERSPIAGLARPPDKDRPRQSRQPPTQQLEFAYA